MSINHNFWREEKGEPQWIEPKSFCFPAKCHTARPHKLTTCTRNLKHWYICPSAAASHNYHCAIAKTTESSCQFAHPKPCLHNFKHCSWILKLKSNILLGMKVFLVMVMMELTTEDVHCTGEITRLQVPAGSPSSGGDVLHKPRELAHSFLKFCSCVYFCLCGPFKCISFHKFSWQLSIFWLFFWSYLCLIGPFHCISLWKSSSAMM